MTDLSGKVALVTGAAGGIGAATAEVLAGYGAKVVIGDIQAEAAQATAERLGSNVSAVAYDASDVDSITSLVDAVVEQHGGLDILHNNAAITAAAWSRDTTLLDTEIDWYDRTMAVNLRSTFVLSKLAVPHMIRRGGGSIVNMASIAAFSGSPTLIAYGISKAGVAALTKYMAVQYGRNNVRTNCIAPGAVLTEQVLANVPGVEEGVLSTLPWIRGGVGKDMGNVVAFLSSKEGEYINGQVITVDGGSTAGVAAPKVELPAEHGVSA
ncbi:SDR family NAD(P)-dependent oxidoreductase [Nakamurella leprariae]|uniref:Glucose 1-dehydrogenase n=1 Tax=Nakamurella leprariae TaxID=2803911 RepID=A0A938Y9I5_9ACTN|nr:glucose 1-dehydrogenase [Nakamurella leprariae]MBM9468345.1 glucose 1-dehydrogenase [Nakamurella leprariae]